MRSYSPAIEAQLASRRLRRRLAVRFDLPSGSYGFITGFRGSLTYAGVAYVGSGGLIEIDQPEAAQTAEASEITVSLASHRRINGETVQLFDPHLLNSIEDEVWFMRPAVIQRFWFNAARQLEDVEQMHLRQIFSVEHKRSGEGRRVIARLMAPSAFAKVFEAKRNGPDLQRLIDATDTGWDDALTTLVDPIYWGRAAPKANGGKGK
jgi:hypothetical protein